MTCTKHDNKHVFILLAVRVCHTKQQKGMQRKERGKGCWKGGNRNDKLHVAKMRFALDTVLDFINKIGRKGE